MPRDLDPGLARHAQVEDRDGRLPQLDLLDRVVAVAGAAGDLDPVLGEHIGDRLDDRRMVVGDEDGGHGPVRHRGLRSLRRGSDSVVGEHERSAAAIKNCASGTDAREDHRDSDLRHRRNLRARHAGPPDPRRAARALESSRRPPRLGRARARRRGAGDEAPRPDRADAAAPAPRSSRSCAPCRASSGSSRSRRAELSVGAAAADAVALVERVLPTHDVELRTSGDATTVAGPGEIRRQLVELLLDALDAPGRGPVVELGGRRRRRHGDGRRRAAALAAEPLALAGRRAARRRPRPPTHSPKISTSTGVPGATLAAGR